MITEDYPFQVKGAKQFCIPIPEERGVCVCSGVVCVGSIYTEVRQLFREFFFSSKSGDLLMEMVLIEGGGWPVFYLSINSNTSR